MNILIRSQIEHRLKQLQTVLTVVKVIFNSVTIEM